MKNQLINKFIEKINKVCGREKDVEFFNVVMEILFFISNIYMICYFNKNNRTTFYLFLITILVISIVIQGVFVIFSRYVAVKSRCRFDYDLYLYNFVLYSIFAYSLILIYASSDFEKIILSILILYRLFDSLNYIIFINIKSKVFIFTMLLMLFISMSIDNDSYSVILTFIIFVLGISNLDDILSFFNVDDIKVDKNLIISDKLLAIILLIDIYISMILGRVTKYLILKYTSLTFGGVFTYGLLRFLFFFILIGITFMKYDRIKEEIGEFIKKRYLEDD